MSLFHYYVVELDLPEVTSACTINGNPGFGTPLTCTDQDNHSIVTKTHKFTDTSLIIGESDVYKCVNRVNETTPMLKSGNGVASTATCTISMRDFTGDPNLSSPALVSNASIKNKGSFFGKLKSRNVLTNKPLRVRYYESDGRTSTLKRTHHYMLVDVKQSANDMWTFTCKDVLYKADDENSDFPKIVIGTLQSDITEGETTINMNADIADWTPYSDYTAVVSGDLMMITDATGTSSSVTLTVVRANTITLGSRTIENEPSTHSAGDEVFRGRKFVNADPYDVLVKVFEDADLTTDNYNASVIQSELDEWLPNLKGSIDAIIYEHEDTTKFLDAFCATLMLDMWTDLTTGKIVIKATSPWNTTTAILREGIEINYGSISVDEDADLYYSRAFLQYDKRKLTESDDDANFARSSLAYDATLEGEYFYNAEKVKDLGKSIVLSNKLSNIETAELTTVRYAQRFSNRPQRIISTVEEKNLNFSLGDVVEIESAVNQDFYGNPNTGVRAQVVKIAPLSSVGRNYKVTAVTYNPYIGGVAGSDLPVNAEFDNNLFTIAGGPVSADTFTFIFSLPFYGQDTLNQAISAGSFPAGSTINLVFLNGSTAIGRGGNGNGGNGGDTLRGANGVTINIYLSGPTPDFGNGSYNADGYLFAPGGGGGEFEYQQGEDEYEFNYVIGGSGGAGNKPGGAGTGDQDGFPGEKTEGGRSNGQAGKGGNPGEDGESTNGAVAFQGGLAGRCLSLNGSTVNIYTNGNVGRFIKGRGDNPSAIS